MDAGAGEQFMSVRPYKGAIVEPDNRKINYLLILKIPNQMKLNLMKNIVWNIATVTGAKTRDRTFF